MIIIELVDELDPSTTTPRRKQVDRRSRPAPAGKDAAHLHLPGRPQKPELGAALAERLARSIALNGLLRNLW